MLLVAITLCGPLGVRAQNYHWTRGLAGDFQSVGFNPLSNGRIIFAGSYDSSGIYRSDDGGQTWTNYQSGMDAFATSDIRQFYCLPTDTSIVIAVSPTKLYRSTNGGMSWSEPLSGTLGGILGEDVGYHEATDVLYYGQFFAGPTWKSLDRGATWQVSGEANDTIGICTIAVSPDTPPTLLSGSELGKLVRSTNEGATWTTTLSTDTGTSNPPEVPKIVYSRHALDAQGRHGVAVAARWPSDVQTLVYTIDDGRSWSKIDAPTTKAWALDIDQRIGMLSRPTDPAYPRPLRYWTGLFNVRSDTARDGLVIETRDGGLTWSGTNFPSGTSGGPNDPLIRKIWVIKYDTTSGRLAVAANTGIYIANTAAEVKGAPSSIEVQVTVRQSFVTIESPQPRCEIELHDILGRVVAKTHTDVGRAQLTSEHLPRGSYFLVVRSTGSTPYVQSLVLGD